ncbi:Hypothetical predicted protein [Cloeon dipterum]|uniref:C-type lectin domain-containing protein n=1 Tax=Cloeon dipterum TaxID=197152 RepID=A0A8S1C218_9INSE|nr:Hypothetical predicted protein [Cloeon dipterum]
MVDMKTLHCVILVSIACWFISESSRVNINNLKGTPIRVFLRSNRQRRIFIIKCCGRQSCSKSFNRISRQPTSSPKSNTMRQINSTETMVSVSTNNGDPASSTADLTQTTQEHEGDIGESTQIAENLSTNQNQDAETTNSNRIETEPNSPGVITTKADLATTTTPVNTPSLLPSATEISTTTTTTTTTLDYGSTISTSTAAASGTIISASTVSGTFPRSTAHGFSTTIVTKADTQKISTTVLTTTINPKQFVTIFEYNNSTCKRNVSLFSNDDHLIDAKDYGYWTEACGKLFLWGKTVVNWQTNHDKCCSLGMTPITMENENKKKCLENITKPSVWKHNYNYWTAARKTGMNGTFQLFEWCLPNATNFTTFGSTSSYWMPGQPRGTNGENCVHLQVNKSLSKVFLTARNCSNLYVFGCQGKPTPAPPCFAPKCPAFNCDKNPSFFSTLADGVTKYLTNPSSHGFWFTVNGRSYVFNSAKKSWLDAAKSCCAIGMKILSIEFDYEYNNLIAAANNSTSANGIFWTSGTDDGCEGNFGWCAVNKLARSQETKWQPGEPNNYAEKENCIFLSLTKTSGTLFDADCSTSQMYICEARDTTKTTSNSEAMVDECGAAFNVSKEEARQILNATIFSLKIKCFLKCLGENGGFMLNGKLVDENILLLAESMANNPDIMQENMIAVSTCGSKRGMDECDTASLIFQCGQEKAPEFVANVINTVELNKSSESVPLPGTVGKCLTDFDCVTDPQMRDDYLNNRAIPNGNIFTACGVKYLIIFSRVSYQEAFSLCCKYGLKLSSFKSPSDLSCLIDTSKSTIPVLAEHAWLAASRLGVTNYTWCTTSSPFNLFPTITDRFADRAANPGDFLLSVKFDAQPAAVALGRESSGSICFTFCMPDTD